MKKNRIVIVECYSSAVNYIHDIRARGFEPVLLECYAPEDKREEIRRLNDEAYAFNGDPRPLVLMADKSYGSTLEMIRRLSPVLIIPGADTGLELAMRLSEDLGLRGNPLSIFPRLRDKLAMQETLKNSGLRFIRSRAVFSEEEALDFYKEEQGRRVVIKLTRSAGSQGVFICHTEDEVRNAYLTNSQSKEDRARTGENVIIQEYIDGDEYVIDTLACGGRYAALFAMKYIKRERAGYGKIYDTDIYLSPDDPALTGLTEYNYKMLSCLGVEYGPVHSEFMVDEKGPVLIEVNARPAGVFQKYTFQDKVMENHETDAALDSFFMEQGAFFDRYLKLMHLKQPAAVKQICLEEDIFVKKVKLNKRLSRLESFDYAIENGENRIYPKTVDLDTNGGIIYLTHPDEEVIKKDIEAILKLEREGLDELYDWHRA